MNIDDQWKTARVGYVGYNKHVIYEGKRWTLSVPGPCQIQLENYLVYTILLYT